MKTNFRIFAIVGASCFAGFANAQMIFNGGGPDQTGGNEVTQWVQTEDFQLTSNDTVGGVRFWTGEVQGSVWDGTLQWWIFADNAGTPGSIIGSGNGTNVSKVATGLMAFGAAPEYVYNFDLDTPTALNGSTTYWLGLHLSSDYNRDEIYWENTSSGFGSTGMESDGGTFNNWSNNGSHHAFELYAVPEPGTFIAIGIGLAGLALARRRK